MPPCLYFGGESTAMSVPTWRRRSRRSPPCTSLEGFSTRELWDGGIESHRDLDDGARERLATAFEEEAGRPPRAGEVAAAFGAHLPRNQAFLEQMLLTHDRLLDELPDQVQFVRRPERAPVGFITADVPVALTDGRRVGILAGVGVRSAGACFIPLSRDVGAFLTTRRERDVDEVPIWVVQKLNHLVWQGSLRQIACHPLDDWRRALARSGRR